MAFFAENIAFIMAILVSVITYVLMQWAKLPIKYLTKLLPFCKNNKLVSTAINAGAGLSESCVIASLLVSLVNIVGKLDISMDWAVLAGCLANFAYLFIENIGKSKRGELTDADDANAATALNQLVDAFENVNKDGNENGVQEQHKEETPQGQENQIVLK